MKQLLVLLACLLLPSGVLSAAEEVDYVRDIKPILQKRCVTCHGPLRQKGELRLDTAAMALQDAESGPAIVPGNSDESYLFERITEEPDSRMPPKEEGAALKPDQIASIKAWIDQGAKAPKEPTPADPRKHWSYLPPLKPRPPQLADASWARNPIDAFIGAEYQKHDLTPSGPAKKHVLLRRVYLDLIGLPPTRAQQQAFLDDSSADAYDRVVQRLLESPQYGERWGRHWMDVWRYSDWSGYQKMIRNSQRHIWRWRDWIVESLNEDKGYDQMVREMLAGDEIAPADPKTLRATGYLARSWFKYNRNTWLDGTVEHVAKAFLGVTINCARCHEHKFDPIENESYYQLRAFFEPHDVRTDRVPGQSGPMKGGLARIVDLNPDVPTYIFARGHDLYPDKDNPVSPEVPPVLGGKLEIKPVELPIAAWYPALQGWVLKEDIENAQKKIADAAAAIEKSNAELASARAKNDSEAQRDADPNALAQAEAAAALGQRRLSTAQAEFAALLARIASEKAKYDITPGADKKKLAAAAGAMVQTLAVCRSEEHLLTCRQKVEAARRALKKGDKKAEKTLADAKKQLAAGEKKLKDARAALAKPSTSYKPLGKIFPRTSTGRRLALARWITDRNNPLAARVAINHIWLRHTGQALVDNMFDFGLRSQQVHNAPLLDWLAVELMDHGWSMKHIHRLIVTSNTYRMTSAAKGSAQENLKKDEHNRFLWRMNSRSLEAESVRDSILQVAGNLDLKMGGPEIDQTTGQILPRRSIYFRHAYEKQMRFLELFDGASVNECYRRSQSIVPHQALAMANSRISLEQSRRLANRLRKEAEKEPDGQTAFIVAAFHHVLSRAPSGDELNDCQQFLHQQAARLADPSKLTRFMGGTASSVKPAADPEVRACENLVHVLLNHNDFVTIR